MTLIRSYEPNYDDYVKKSKVVKYNVVGLYTSKFAYLHFFF